MADLLQFDEKALLNLEATYRAPEVVAQRRILLDSRAARPGESTLGIGYGPGFVTAELANAVGTAGTICAVDSSESAIAMTRHCCAEFANVQVQFAEATQLPYADEYFDLAMSTQEYEFVPQVQLALSELHRVLRPGGRISPLHGINTRRMIFCDQPVVSGDLRTTPVTVAAAG
jgi:arsenite methyltransferase